MRRVDQTSRIPAAPDGGVGADSANSSHLLNARRESNVEAERGDLREETAALLRIQREFVKVHLVALAGSPDFFLAPGVPEAQKAEAERLERIDFIVRAHAHGRRPRGEGDLNPRAQSALD
jgi:hypothetical protein